jgi:hypothetical protein
MEVCKYCGATKKLSADGCLKTWHVWGQVALDGELHSIRYGISNNIIYADKPITRDRLDTDLRKALWRFASEQATRPQEDECTVIEKYIEPRHSNVVPFGAKGGHSWV